jgi:hypothetical protein
MGTCETLLEGYIPPMSDAANTSPEVPVTRLRRAEAVIYARRRLGQSVTVNTIRTWPIAYQQIGRDAVYKIADLDRFIDERLKAAPVRRAGPAPDFAGMVEDRRRLLVGDAGEEEARLRALEYVAGLAARHYGCDLQTAANLVRAKLKEKA